MTEDAYVRRFGFRRYEGIRSNRISRIISVSWFNLGEAIRRSGFTKMLLVFMIIGLLVQDLLAILITSLVPSSMWGDITVNEMFRATYADSIIGMISLTNRVSTMDSDMAFLTQFLTIGSSFMFILLLAVVSGGLISDDRLFQATEAYYSRISRFEYVLGKLFTLIIFSMVFVSLPAVMQYFLLAQGLEVNMIANLDLLLWGLGTTLLSSVVLSIVTLAFSSLTKRRNLATLSFFMAAMIMSALPAAFGLVFATEPTTLIIDFVGCIGLLAAMFLGRSSVTVNGQTVRFYNGLGLEGYMVVATVALLVFLGVLALVLTLFRRDS
ncbi:MAG: hypothetical protein JSW61_00340 [Candidatus Thorarchaeota archaeon]|nr:MAG: hypothetical protein JSW61_00340 [Candidatus Thorarchaeota archaeon]